MWNCSKTQFMETPYHQCLFGNAVNISRHANAVNRLFSIHNKRFSSNSTGKAWTKNKFWPISIVCGCGVLFIANHLRKRTNTTSKSSGVTVAPETYHVPHCKGSSATLAKYGQFWLPQELIKDEKKLREIQRFNIREDDVIVASFPKSGTTWIQEIVYLILTTDEDVPPSADSTIEERFPYIEYVYPGLKALDRRREKRLMKTHLPREYLPDGVLDGTGKVIYIARNPKDVAVSYYHFIRMLSITKYSGEFVDFGAIFEDGKVPYGPWDEHVLQYWSNREDKNMLFITFEDLHKTPEESVRRIAKFLGKSLTTNQLHEVVQRSSFTNMKINPMVNYSWWRDMGIVSKDKGQFMRKGKVGDWKNYFSEEMNSKYEKSLVETVKQEGLIFTDDL